MLLFSDMQISGPGFSRLAPGEPRLHFMWGTWKIFGVGFTWNAPWTIIETHQENFIAQLVEHCRANAEATGSNPVEAPKNLFSGYFAIA